MHFQGIYVPPILPPQLHYVPAKIDPLTPDVVEQTQNEPFKG